MAKEKHTKDAPTLGEIVTLLEIENRLIANHNRRFHEQIDRLLDAMGVPENKPNNTVEIWGKQ